MASAGDHHRFILMPDSESNMANKNGNGHKAFSQTPQLYDDGLAAAIAHQVLTSLSSTAQKPVPGPQASKSFADFASSLDALVASNDELRAAIEATMVRSARQALASSDSAVPSTQDMAALLRGGGLAAKGGTVVRAFWWGFHIQVSHEDLQSFLGGANAVNTIVDVIGGNIPSPAAPFIHLAAVFVAGALQLLAGLDRGNGVYISMSWFAPGVFVPTSV
jgi:hypothetical protein